MAGRRRDEERAGITGSQEAGWRIRVRIVGLGERDRSLPAGSPYSEAVRLRETLREELRAQTPKPPAVPTLGDYEAAWLARKAAEGVTQGTLEAWITQLARAPRWLLELRIDRITRPDLQRYGVWLSTPEARIGRYPHLARTAPPAPRTIQRTWRTLLQCLRDALADHGVSPDPTQRLRLHVPEPEPAGRALDVVQCQALLTAARARGAFDHAAILLLLTTGLRRAELCKLRREDLDLGPSPHLRVRGTKTRAARRIVPVSPDAAEALRAHLFAAPEGEWLFWRRQYRGCPEDAGRPWGVQSLESLVHRLGVEAGLGRVEPHDLRRTCVTLLHAAGVDDLSRRLVAGHTSAAVSELYTRPTASALAEKLRPGWRLLEGNVGAQRGDGEEAG